MFILIASVAFADTVTLDNGTLLAAALARYELDGDCQMTMTEGELEGAIVIVPCYRVLSFTRTSNSAPLVLRAQTTDAVVDAGALEMPLTPSMPDSVGALRDDGLLTPFPTADAEAREFEAADGDEADGDEAQGADGDEETQGADAATPRAPRLAPSMPVVPREAGDEDARDQKARPRRIEF
ncbi:MAG: hypothetical protein EXR71_18370 [Myxococcales bacterium]|nr:hypothetical protein [Myxococcales bacterium]